MTRIPARIPLIVPTTLECDAEVIRLSPSWNLIGSVNTLAPEMGIHLYIGIFYLLIKIAIYVEFFEKCI